MSDMDIEAPVDDAIEQHQSVVGGPDDVESDDWPREMPFDANEADAAEQVRTVELDEDDYR
jgi:hypothetical protein